MAKDLLEWDLPELSSANLWRVHNAMAKELGEQMLPKPSAHSKLLIATKMLQHKLKLQRLDVAVKTGGPLPRTAPREADEVPGFLKRKPIDTDKLNGLVRSPYWSKQAMAKKTTPAPEPVAVKAKRGRKPAAPEPEVDDAPVPKVRKAKASPVAGPGNGDARQRLADSEHPLHGVGRAQLKVLFNTLIEQAKDAGLKKVPGFPVLAPIAKVFDHRSEGREQVMNLKKGMEAAGLEVTL